MGRAVYDRMVITTNGVRTFIIVFVTLDSTCPSLRSEVVINSLAIVKRMLKDALQNVRLHRNLARKTPNAWNMNPFYFYFLH